MFLVTVESYLAVINLGHLAKNDDWEYSWKDHFKGKIKEKKIFPYSSYNLSPKKRVFLFF